MKQREKLISKQKKKRKKQIRKKFTQKDRWTFEYWRNRDW